MSDISETPNAKYRLALERELGIKIPKDAGVYVNDGGISIKSSDQKITIDRYGVIRRTQYCNLMNYRGSCFRNSIFGDSKILSRHINPVRVARAEEIIKSSKGALASLNNMNL